MNADEKLAQWMDDREARESSSRRATSGMLIAGSDAWKLMGAGGAVVLVLALCFAPWHGSPSDSRSRATRVSDPNARFLSEYQREIARHRELGNKVRMTPAEHREYLILDGRIGVKEGIWSEADFERQVGEKY